MQTHEMFVGTEIEGPDAGILTFYIPHGAIGKRGVVQTLYLIKSTGIRRVYFGAGGHRGIDHEDVTLMHILTQNHAVDQIVAEIEVNEIDNTLVVLNKTKLPNKIQLVLCVTVTGAGDEPAVVKHLKIQNDNKLFWFTLQNPQCTCLDDPEYQEDELI